MAQVSNNNSKGNSVNFGELDSVDGSKNWRENNCADTTQESGKYGGQTSNVNNRVRVLPSSCGGVQSSKRVRSND